MKGMVKFSANLSNDAINLGFIFLSFIQSIQKEENSSGGTLSPISKAKGDYPTCQ